jgi:hypothetical protein
MYKRSNRSTTGFGGSSDNKVAVLILGIASLSLDLRLVNLSASFALRIRAKFGL